MRPPTVYLVREVWAVRADLCEIRTSTKAEAERIADEIHRRNVYTPPEMYGGGMDAAP